MSKTADASWHGPLRLSRHAGECCDSLHLQVDLGTRGVVRVREANLEKAHPSEFWPGTGVNLLPSQVEPTRRSERQGLS